MMPLPQLKSSATLQKATTNWSSRQVTTQANRSIKRVLQRWPTFRAVKSSSPNLWASCRLRFPALHVAWLLWQQKKKLKQRNRVSRGLFGFSQTNLDVIQQNLGVSHGN